MHATSFVVTQAQTLSAFIVSRLAPFTKALKDLASDVNAARIRASSLIAMAWQKKFRNFIDVTLTSRLQENQQQ
jgi:hypothetical protein